MEINLLNQYPSSERPIEERAKAITEADREIARSFGRDYFDGDRLHGYGGYNYHPKYWRATVRRIVTYYGLEQNEISSTVKVLDVGCAKGFFLYDLKTQYPWIEVTGIDVSGYAISHAPDLVRPFLQLGNAYKLDFEFKSFDLVVSINTLHNLPLYLCKNALREIERVAHASFITVDAWRTEEERERLEKWNLTALTYMHVDEWKKVFEEVGYTGDYYWFIP